MKMMDPVGFATFVSLNFCEGGARIDVKYYVAVLELLTVTGKMFAYTGDVKVLCVVMSLLGLFSMNFVRYDQFGRVLTIPEN